MPRRPSWRPIDARELARDRRRQAAVEEDVRGRERARTPRSRSWPGRSPARSRGPAPPGRCSCTQEQRRVARPACCAPNLRLVVLAGVVRVRRLQDRSRRRRTGRRSPPAAAPYVLVSTPTIPPVASLLTPLVAHAEVRPSGADRSPSRPARRTTACGRRGWRRASAMPVARAGVTPGDEDRDDAAARVEHRPAAPWQVVGVEHVAAGALRVAAGAGST